MSDIKPVPPHLVILAAVAANRVIGANNTLPWRLPDDLKRFKALTLGHPVIMGRKTWQSLGRALPGRHNIVITRQPDFAAPGATRVASLDTALAACDGEATAFVIGGAEIYVLALPLADRLELTEIHAEIEGDAWFPPLDPAAWREVAREPRRSAEGLAYDFVSYARQEPPAITGRS
ncbi:MAG: dihydrofolate reductase [Betaproteobacteria bacterium HGW-Betaproteobacteria-11]|nr:MAG: dihydrofolate reductase [Betaproteobacteria bacterium HGW-Betaproteobacteria-11]